MIGCIDYDFMSQGRGTRVPPSLILMKLAQYYRQQKIELTLLSSLNQIEACEKVYFYSVLPLNELPTELLLYTNLIFIGPYFSEKLPSLVDHMAPNVSLYNTMIQEMVNDERITTNQALKILDSYYYQAKVDGELIPVPPMPPKKKIYIYDENFFDYDDCFIILDKIISKKPSSIYFVHPIMCRTISKFFFIRTEYEKVSRENKIILDYFVPLHQLETYFGKYKLPLLGELTTSSDVRIYLGKNYNLNCYNSTFYIKNLFYCLNLAYSYYSRNIPIKAEVYYQPDVINPYLYFYKALKKWINSKEYDLALEDCFTKKEKKDKLAKLYEAHPIFKQFMSYTKNKLINTRGIWTIL